MNAMQKVVTGFMGVLMVGTILAMPAQAPAKAAATETRAVGMVAIAPVASPELPQDQVRDLTY
jgi:hypothetical protein